MTDPTEAERAILDKWAREYLISAIRVAASAFEYNHKTMPWPRRRHVRAMTRVRQLADEMIGEKRPTKKRARR